MNRLYTVASRGASTHAVINGLEAQIEAGGLGQAPFIGCFTFGEQGRLIDRDLHGNLMISAVAFGR